MLPARRPYEDELASSAVLRCCRQFNLRVTRLGSNCLKRDGWRPAFVGASPLEELATLFALSPQDLLWNHTAFPYATATMQPAHYDSAIANALGRGRTRIGFAAVTQNITTGLKSQRFCRSCAEEEFKRFRESYWHRSHNLPGVIVCLRHQVYLLNSQLPVRSSGALPTALPHECSGRPLGRGRPSSTHLEMARVSCSWLVRQRVPGEHVEPSTYRTMALENGWLSPGKEVGLQALTVSLLGVFTKRFLADAGVPVEAAGAHWAGHMLRPRTTTPFVPAKHAVMQTFLGRPRQPHESLIDHSGGGPGASLASQMDDLYSREARKELKRVLANGRLLTTEEFLRGVGCWSQYRHRMGEMPKLRAVVREFRGSAVTVKRLRPGKQLYRLTRPDDSDR